MGRERTLAQTILSAGAADKVSDWVELTNFRNYTWTLRVVVAAATLKGVLRVRGTNNFPQDPAEPVLVNGVLLSPADAAMVHAAGVITITDPGIGIHTIVLSFPAFPQFIQADWDYTSGDAAANLQVRTSGW